MPSTSRRRCSTGITSSRPSNTATWPAAARRTPSGSEAAAVEHNEGCTHQCCLHWPGATMCASIASRSPAIPLDQLRSHVTHSPLPVGGDEPSGNLACARASARRVSSAQARGPGSCAAAARAAHTSASCGAPQEAAAQAMRDTTRRLTPRVVPWGCGSTCRHRMRRLSNWEVGLRVHLIGCPRLSP